MFNLQSLSEHDITACADELRREINVRERIYGRWIDEGKLTIGQAKAQLDAVELALALVQEHKLYPTGYVPVDRSVRKEVKLPWNR